ncbi:MAG: hypothetical protein JNK76_10055 [Planctomycetales bacterium]|nr:hypothetical protein [Planctomycetales bacterium]MBN8624970.1 hypothetical protein [Planctomycetota bacterium]
MAKIGEEHLSAWLRQGLREARGALYPESNVAQQPEYGLYGTKTPGEVAQDRRDEARDLEDEQRPEGDSVLASRLRQAEARGGRAEPDRDRDRDR